MIFEATKVTAAERAQSAYEPAKRVFLVWYKIKTWFELQYCVNFIFLGYYTNARTSWSKSGPVCETI